LNEQAGLLNPYVDFFYFDVWSSIKEFKCGIKAIKEFNKPYLVGIHISEGKKLPSGENISDIKNIIDDKILGIMLSCVSPENYEINLNELKSLNVPFGFKINGFITTNPKNGYSSTFTKLNGNPNEFLGHREDLTPQKISKIVKRFKESGATILGGCCETRPSHIGAMATVK
jgi:homocysteine S-methyltransferase